MVERDAIIQGGYVPLLEQALDTNSSAAAVFDSAPDGTKFVTFWVGTGTLTLTFDGTTAPVAGSVGIPYPSDGSYDLPLSRTQLLKVKGIGGASGYVVYWGVP